MNKTVTGFIAFALGAAAGAAGTWYILKTKYEQIAQEEIDSVKEVFSKRLADANEEMKKRIHLDLEKDDGSKPVEESLDEEEVDEAKDAADKIIDYSGYSAKEEPEKKEMPEDRPYVISPAEYGEFPGYSTIDLYFFKDNVVTDDELDILEEPDKVIGFESLNHFGEYEDDCVHVRNDRLKCDYAIFLDERTYEEAVEEERV